MVRAFDVGRALSIAAVAAMAGCSAPANKPSPDAGLDPGASGGAMGSAGGSRSVGMKGGAVAGATGATSAAGVGGEATAVPGTGSGGDGRSGGGGAAAATGNGGGTRSGAAGETGGGGVGGATVVATGGRGGSSGGAGREGSVGGAGFGGGPAGGSPATGGAAGGGAVYSPCPVVGTSCKILPFGDSITFGVGSNGGGSNGGYRVQLFHRALQDGKRLTFVGTAAPNGPALVDGAAFPGQNEGHSGATIDNQPATPTLAARSGISPLVGPVMTATKPDIVTLMIGTNDIQHDYDTANAPVRLARLIDSIAAADAHVLIVVAQIPPTADATLNNAVEAFNAAIPAVVNTRTAAGKHILLVDVYHAIATAPDFRTTGRTVPDPMVGPLFDWLHPNVAGYRAIGDAWYDAIKPALR